MQKNVFRILILPNFIFWGVDKFALDKKDKLVKMNR